MLQQTENARVLTSRLAESVRQNISVQLFSSRELHHAALHYICSADSGFILERTAHRLPEDLAFPSNSETNLVIIEATLLIHDDIDGMQVTLKRICELTSVVLLAEQIEPTSIRKAITSGISGYVLTSASLDEFRHALQTVASGSLWFGQTVIKSPMHPPFAERMARSLSQRERQILSYVAIGLTSKEIASKIGLSHSSVRTYWYRVLNKLNALNKAEALVRSAQLGLLDANASDMFE